MHPKLPTPTPWNSPRAPAIASCPLWARFSHHGWPSDVWRCLTLHAILLNSFKRIREDSSPKYPPPQTDSVCKDNILVTASHHAETTYLAVIWGWPVQVWIVVAALWRSLLIIHQQKEGSTVPSANLPLSEFAQNLLLIIFLCYPELCFSSYLVPPSARSCTSPSPFGTCASAKHVCRIFLMTGEADMTSGAA